MRHIFYILLLSLCFFSCKQKEVDTKNGKIQVEEIVATNTKSKKLSKADSIVNKAIKAHGGELYKKAYYSFFFRKKKYTFKNDGSDYLYTVTFRNGDSLLVEDKMESGSFERVIDGKPISLSKKEIDNYSNALNSVIYFTTLPYKLSDESVNKKYIGETTIKTLRYHVVKVTFDQEGGGKDFEDQYYYWISKNENTVDYFAYNYKVNGGGARFRSFYNRKNVDGIIFQDYINWKADYKTPLDSLPKLFESNKLEKASIIENTQIFNLKTKT